MAPLDGDGAEDGPDEPAEKVGRGFVTELVRKMAVAGMGALFMTEEGLRALAGQLKLPKELLAAVLAQAEKTKSEIGRVVTDEIRGFLQSDKVREEFTKLLSQMTIEVKAEIRLKPDNPEASAVEVKELTARRGPTGVSAPVQKRGKKD